MKMLMVVDVGNTNIVIGIFQQKNAPNNLIKSLRIQTKRQYTADEIGYWMLALVKQAKINCNDIKGICISSVVNCLELVFIEACAKYFKKTAFWIKQDIFAKISTLSNVPYDLGADRFVSSYAAFVKFKTNMIIIDLGTATTFDIIDANGLYLGGSISPGFEIFCDSLFQATPELNKITIESPSSFIGKNTKECLQIGLVYGYVGLIDYIATGIKKEFKKNLLIIATGGSVPNIQFTSKIINFFEPDLILHGLFLLYQKYNDII